MLAQLTNAVFPGDDELEEGASRRDQSTSALPCGGRGTICSTNPRIHLPNICTTRSELCDLAVIFWRFSFDILVPSEQILGPGGQVVPGPNDFRQGLQNLRPNFCPGHSDRPPHLYSGVLSDPSKISKKVRGTFPDASAIPT